MLLLTRSTFALSSLVGYVLTIVAANWLTTRYGFVPVGFGLTAIAGTYAAGAALLARDVLQDLAGRRAVLAAIGVGAALSAWLSTPQLALASGVAFLLAELSDMAIYTPLRERGWAKAVIASNAIGSVFDTLVFLLLIGRLGVLPVAGQLVGKFLWATLLPVLIVTLVRRSRRAQTAA